MTDVPAWATEPGLSQVICHCTSEQMLLIISDQAARVICAKCQCVNGEFKRAPGEPLITTDLAYSATHIEQAPEPPPGERLHVPVTHGQAQLLGGPYDGQVIPNPPGDVDVYWVGSVDAAWVTELDLPPESHPGHNLHAYRRTAPSTFTWIPPPTQQAR